MSSTYVTTGDVRSAPSLESSQSAVSWAAIFAGGFITFALAVMLLALGAGFGFSSVSPFSNSGVSATTFTIAAAIWLIVVQWLASALGAYMTGRLRTKWTNVHGDEVMFRDTAHGLLAWAVGLALSLSAAGFAGYASKPAMQNANEGASAYYVDTLFRSSGSIPAAELNDAKAQARVILASSASSGKMSEGDKIYLAQIVAARTGVAAPEANQRIDAVVTRAQSDAEAARKAAAKTSFYTFFSMLVGAFIACVAGAIGGRQRDAF